MAARPTWKGFLKISLVNIPIKVFPATESSGSISFNQLHGECQTRIHQKRWCPHCDREVPSSEIVKGYGFEKGRYVIMSEEDLDKVRPESTRVIDLVQFADASSIDPMYVDRTYYLAPDGGMAADAFAVMRDGMQGKVGIGKLALYGREYLVAVRPYQRGIVMHTLHRCRGRAELAAGNGETRRDQACQTGHLDVRAAAESVGLQGRVPRRAPADHRREDRRRRGGRHRRERGAESGQPDGRPEEEPGCRQRGEEAARESHGRKTDLCETQAGLGI